MAPFGLLKSRPELGLVEGYNATGVVIVRCTDSLLLSGGRANAPLQRGFNVIRKNERGSAAPLILSRLRFQVTPHTEENAISAQQTAVTTKEGIRFSRRGSLYVAAPATHSLVASI